MLLTLLKGFITSGSLIVAIGAQNAFVIRQGLLRQHLFLTALTCSFVDATLIILGVFGFGHLIASYPLLVELSKIFAIVFLFFYGMFSIRSIFKAKSLTNSEVDLPSKKKTIFLLLALSLLNPHVYLDTVILLGSIASQHPDKERLYFAIGAISASFAWFFAITYGSRFASPLLCNPNIWRVIDSLIAIIMWAIALNVIMTL